MTPSGRQLSITLLNLAEQERARQELIESQRKVDDKPEVDV